MTDTPCNGAVIASDEFCRVLNLLCPMHVLLDATGHVVQVGPTLQKLRPDAPMQGRRVLELFDLQRPRRVSSMADLHAIAGQKLHLEMRDAPHTRLKGVLAPLPSGGGAVINLSFGISVLDAVRDYALTSADFAATDLTMEMLYLVEAKSAAMEASRQLNQRLQGAKIAAEEQAFTDTLTGLKNRRALDYILDRLCHDHVPFTLMHLDLDYFKAVNDTHGHAAGDHVLQQAARAMLGQIRKNDIVARVGGDEFILLLLDLDDRAVLDGIAERVIGRIEEPVPFNGKSCRISASIGIAFWSPEACLSPAELIEQADMALYAAKDAGRAQHRFYDSGAGAQTAAE
ncbi:MAG: diguanylate cyclase [Marinibacterium sp.]|nr:diguanylate cyclase [Marinibacterium sp.]